MIQPNKRSKAPRETTGPRVGAIVTREGVTIRVLSGNERPTLPAATVLASDETVGAIRAAAEAVAERVRSHAKREVPILVLA